MLSYTLIRSLSLSLSHSLYHVSFSYGEYKGRRDSLSVAWLRYRIESLIVPFRNTFLPSTR